MALNWDILMRSRSVLDGSAWDIINGTRMGHWSSLFDTFLADKTMLKYRSPPIG